MSETNTASFNISILPVVYLVIIYCCPKIEEIIRARALTYCEEDFSLKSLIDLNIYNTFEIAIPATINEKGVTKKWARVKVIDTKF